MRLSHALFKTERHAKSDAQLVSHKLLVRAGLIRQISAGIYSLTPLAMRIINKIANIVREEMASVGGQEILLPVTQPATLWEESGRYQKIDGSLARWNDRNGQNMVLAMTHEEAVTDLVRYYVQSYRQLPLMLYQIQTKFRDELRPRGGLVRLREFLMNDAYSFHTTVDSLDSYYNEIIAAYERLFQRCGVKVLRVEADTGMMGGGVSHEFMTVSDGGEDTLLVCRHCEYAANREVAVASKSKPEQESPSWRLLMGSDDTPIVVGLMSKAMVSQVKVARVLGFGEVRDATLDEREKLHLDLPTQGWLKSTELERAGCAVIVDDAFAQQAASFQQDFPVADIVAIEAGEHCANCGEPLETLRGIEVGNIFKLGTAYSETMHATFTDTKGLSRPLLMGCYGIGITRLLACIIEDNHDEKGIVFPESIAPYRYYMIAIGTDNEVIDTAEQIYACLGSEEVLYDNRDVTAGVKFADCDLLGLPYRLTVSKRSLADGGIELYDRRTGAMRMLTTAEIESTLAR